MINDNCDELLTTSSNIADTNYNAQLEKIEICKTDTLQTVEFPNSLIDLSEQGNNMEYLKNKFIDSQDLENRIMVEISSSSWTNKYKRSYLRGCLWSPDGTCVLSAVNGDGLHIVELPTDMYLAESLDKNRPLEILQSAVHVKESGTVYDFAWYPKMLSSMPETCCWISSRQHEPLQLWDGFNGSLRCSYRGYDTVDEIEAALSAVFSADGNSIYGGYKKSLKIFQTAIPGRDSRQIVLNCPASSLAMHPIQSNLIAVGSWNKSITLIDTSLHKPFICDKFIGNCGGITYMKFTPDGNYLVSGARKNENIYFWDLRQLNSPAFTLNRNVNTNQKIYFDITVNGKWLISGDTSGTVRAWDLCSLYNGRGKLFKYPLHKDCCNGVSLHPTKPILATSSGQYHNSNKTDDEELSNHHVRLIEENSLSFWWYGPIKD